ncbi:hypothetical protein, partial [Pseudomonas sp. Sample_24]|uniref:hypothetical protein n=1 Tax=Pseudomonas sp. Sample_24 TaxID=2448268 RepID=UPI0019D506EC
AGFDPAMRWFESSRPCHFSTSSFNHSANEVRVLDDCLCNIFISVVSPQSRALAWTQRLARLYFTGGTACSVSLVVAFATT